MSLSATLDVFQRWLYLPDPDPVVATLSTVAANRLGEEATWIQLVGSPGSGKTEIVQAVCGLAEVHPVATMTEAYLLSGVSRRDRTEGSKGGLLKEIGDYGIILMKDFGSILSMNHEARGHVLGAMREIYDGSWERGSGADGGMKLTWKGRVGLIAGVTPIIDEHHGVMAALGERFCFYRMRVDDRQQQARGSLSHFQSEQKMRSALREAVMLLFEGLDTSGGLRLKPKDEQPLVALSDFVTRARSSVPRDRYTREILMVPEAEAPGRLVGALARILAGARMIGADSETAWRIVRKIAFDSMPAQRFACVQIVRERPQAKTSEIAEWLGLPTTTTRRSLEDLTAHKILSRTPGGEGKADLWTLSRDTLAMVGEITFPATAGSEKAGSENGKLPGLDERGNGSGEGEQTVPAKSYTSSLYESEIAGTLPKTIEGATKSEGVPSYPAEETPPSESSWGTDEDMPF